MWMVSWVTTSVNSAVHTRIPPTQQVGSSCQGRATALAEYLQRYNSDCCMAVERYDPFGSPGSPILLPHAWVDIVCKCDTCDRQFANRVMQFTAITGGHPEGPSGEYMDVGVGFEENGCR